MDEDFISEFPNITTLNIKPENPDTLERIVELLENINTHFMEYKSYKMIRPYRSSLYINSSTYFSLDRKGRNHLYIMSPTSTVLNFGEQGTLALSSGEWTLIPHVETTRISVIGATTSIPIYFVCTNDVIP